MNLIDTGLKLFYLSVVLLILSVPVRVFLFPESVPWLVQERKCPEGFHMVEAYAVAGKGLVRELEGDDKPSYMVQVCEKEP